MKIKKHFSNFKLLLFLFLVFFNSSHILGQKTSTGDTDWNTASTWSPAGVPIAGDNVIIRAGDIVTVNASPSNPVASITFNRASALESGLNIAAGVTLNVLNNVTLWNAAATSTTASISGMGTLTCGTLDIGRPVIRTTSGNPLVNTLNLNIKTINVTQTITLNNSDYGTGSSSQPVLNINSGCTLTANLLNFTHHLVTTGNGGFPDNSKNSLKVNSGGTLTLCNFPPIQIEYRIKLNDITSPQINVDFLSGSTVNFVNAFVTVAPQSINNGLTTATTGTASPLVINYSGTTNLGASRVAISTPTTTICSGNNVTFTATPTAGGSNPSYQWKINGTNTGTNSPLNSTFTSSTLNTNDSVTVVMTTNNSCVQTATSNAIVLTVNPSPASPTVGTPSMPSCEAIFGSINLSDLPATGWTLTQSGTSSSTATGSGTTTTVSGLVNGTYTYTVTGTNGCVSPPTSSVVITGNSTTYNGTIWSNGEPDLTKIAIFDGDYISSSNLSACGVIVNTGKTVTFTNSNVLTVKNEVTVNGSLIFENNTSLVQENDSAINTGDIIYKRTANGVNGYDYVYWSSPVTGQDISSIYSITTPGFKYFWDPLAPNINSATTTTTGNWQPASGAMTPATGYIIRGSTSFGMPATNIPATFTGVPNNGIITTTISRGGNQILSQPGVNGATVTVTAFDDNWNLVGNPYPSAIDALSFLGDSNNSTIEGFVWLWRHLSAPAPLPNPFYGSFDSNYNTNSYIEFNAMGSNPIGFNGKIAAGQGFFVRMVDGGAVSSSITFNNLMRNNGYNNSQFYRTTTVQEVDEKNRIWLDLVDGNNQSVSTLVGYTAQATLGLDRLYDAIINTANDKSIYTLVDNSTLTIQGRPTPFDQNDQVPIGVTILTEGDYKIAIAAVDGLFEHEQPIYLEDKELNIIYDLRQSPYSFSSAAGIFNARFVLRYTNTALVNPDFGNIENSVIVAGNQGELTIKSSIENIQEVTIYDVLGRQLFFTKEINNTHFITSNISLSQQTLIVKIKLENGMTISRKVIL
jgi:hypothetical protein